MGRGQAERTDVFMQAWQMHKMHEMRQKVPYPKHPDERRKDTLRRQVHDVHAMRAELPGGGNQHRVAAVLGGSRNL